MNDLLARDTFIIKERVALVKLTDTFDILDAATGKTVGIAEETPAPWAKWLRLLITKKFLPNKAEVRTPLDEGGVLVFKLSKDAALFRHHVQVLDANGHLIGTLISKVLTLGGGFFVHDPQGRQVAEVVGDWIGWNFALKSPEGTELGKVVKKWNGLGREFLTSADSYVVELPSGSGAAGDRKMLLLAAALSIDFIYKEQQ